MLIDNRGFVGDTYVDLLVAAKPKIERKVREMGNSMEQVSFVLCKKCLVSLPHYIK